MKIIVVGAGGAVGQAIIGGLGDGHEIITVGRKSGDILADVEDVNSIREMYAKAGRVDAVVSAIGHGHFGPVDTMTSDQFMKGIHHKTLPQVNLVLEGIPHMNDGGSFTLTSGVLNRDPVRGGSASAAANGAIDGFVLGASIEMPRGIRINSVSADVLEVSRQKYAGVFPGHRHVSSEEVGLGYCKCIEGVINGQVVIV